MYQKYKNICANFADTKNEFQSYWIKILKKPHQKLLWESSKDIPKTLCLTFNEQLSSTLDNIKNEKKKYLLLLEILRGRGGVRGQNNIFRSSVVKP